MKRLTILFALLFGFSLFASQVEILNRKIDIHILKDGRVIKHVYEKIKINGFTGMRRAGEWFYTYNPELTEVNIIKSVTHNSEGEVISAPKNAVLDFSPYSTENAPDFSNIREKIVSHTGLEPYCIVEFEYEIKDKVPHRLIVFEDLRDRFPVKKVEVSIVDNKHCALYTNNLKLNLGDNVFVAKNIKPLATNLTANYYYDKTPLIAIVIKNPANYLKNYLKSLPEKGSNEVLKLMGLDNLSGKGLVYAVFDFIDKRLNTVYLSPETYNYKCRDFKEVVKSGYATPLEKRVLAYWILKSEGFHTSFLLSCKWEKNGIYFIRGYGVEVDGILWPYKRAELPYYNLSGKRVFAKDVKASLRVDAEEGEKGFEGKFFFEGLEGIGVSVAGLKKVDVKDLEKANGFVVKEGKVEGKLKDKLVLSNWFEYCLPFGFSDFAFFNFVEVPYSIDLSETYVIKFKKPVKAIFHSKKIGNLAGFSEVNYSVEGKTLKIKRVIKIKPGFYEGKKLKELQSLLIPVVSESYSTVFFE